MSSEIGAISLALRIVHMHRHGLAIWDIQRRLREEGMDTDEAMIIAVLDVSGAYCNG